MKGEAHTFLGLVRRKAYSLIEGVRDGVYKLQCTVLGKVQWIEKKICKCIRTGEEDRGCKGEASRTPVCLGGGKEEGGKHRKYMRTAALEGRCKKHDLRIALCRGGESRKSEEQKLVEE